MEKVATNYARLYGRKVAKELFKKLCRKKGKNYAYVHARKVARR